MIALLFYVYLLSPFISCSKGFKAYYFCWAIF